MVKQQQLHYENKVKIFFVANLYGSNNINEEKQNNCTKTIN
jgi:hypothetical protein